jgi:hypothetical protein
MQQSLWLMMCSPTDCNTNQADWDVATQRIILALEEVAEHVVEEDEGSEVSDFEMQWLDRKAKFVPKVCVTGWMSTAKPVQCSNLAILQQRK